MKVEIENAPIVDRKSWVGQAIEMTGAKTWCSLLVRGSIILSLVILYLSGLVFMFSGGVDVNNSIWEAFWVVYTVLLSIVAGVFAIGFAGVGIGAFNCWAQDKCTPIFKDE